MQFSKPDHHHGYVWSGHGSQMKTDGPRRANSPDFRTATITPLELADWLRKPPQFVRGTFRDPQEAANWVAEQTQEHSPSFESDHARETLHAHIESAGAAVRGGEDFCGGWWLKGGRFLSVCLIACSPHRMRPDYGCPKP
ncbi:hypothetical protein LRS74_23030 [Streptomyces sp. LX-29]|uniref:hypothetical protein n=1 Tax=Streptomyces sp. LX-29 TaxID=2900152 RepID=UPI00240D2D73|nr:hypothetical protein [Streptomyces sp. LX-29]WFB09596.1 hypothetical protein LRS74_23030 [Streptomyces sp. LX-29]